MDWTVATYLAYLLIAIPLTVWVATTLSRHGGVFLEEVFGEHEDVAEAVNRLLVVGFYLLNLGFVSLYLRNGGEVADLRGLVEQLSVKIGVVTLVLGVLHFLNVWVFSSMRRRQRIDAYRAAPVAPQSYVPPMPAFPAS
ncbi:hypothetical protein FE634_03500 [Nocardioides dongxiaopingii]|uniref:hypothetical protein n=1 Tax=Nocardioides TaxID=1839 RepID=UPI0010C763D4|nr:MULTISPECIES: hypothetical protein [Nocardioides]QCW49702.1 hypothetical protein FE634_03500 [Nocardioides sp. S-1144]